MNDDSTVAEEPSAAEPRSPSTIDSALAELGLGIGIMQGGKLTYANDALRHILGYDEELAETDDIAALVKLQDAQRHRERNRARMAGQDAPTRFVVTVEHASGRPIDLDVSTVVDERTDPPSTLHVVRDVTETASSERRLRQSHKMQAIGQLATGIAHDFNNYLTALRLTTEALEDCVHGLEARELIAELEQLTVGAVRLTRQLLAFGGRDLGQPTVLDVNVAIFETMTMLERLMGERVELVTRLEPGLPPVEADEGQFQQVIVNLVMNARDALEDEGRVTIETSATDDDEPGVQVVISDDGVGMARQTLDRAFEPYFTTRPREHSGMGLSIVYGAVQQLRGTIDIASSPGEGTTVSVVLPAERAPFEPRPVDEHASTVLLVEDEATLRQLLTAGLRRHCYRIIAVADGDEALERIEAEANIDILVTDLVIPGASGEIVVERFEAAHPRGAVVVISGYSDSLDTDLIDAPAVEFLRKPFSAVELVEAIRRVTGEFEPSH